VIERVTTPVLSYNKSLKECEDGSKIKLKTWFSITWDFKQKQSLITLIKTLILF
jgi:hypothetical protein